MDIGKCAKVYVWAYLIAILIFFSKTFKKVSSRVNKSQQNVNKIQKTVKLKELDEFGTFFKKVIHSVFFIMFWSKIVISSKGALTFNPNDS